MISLFVPTLPSLMLLASAPSAPQQGLPLRSFDGSGTVPNAPLEGAAHTPLLRLAEPIYEDGHSTPTVGDLPPARDVSNALCIDQEILFAEGRASDWVWLWGQFVDHDLDLSERAEPDELLEVQIPAGDPWFDPGHTGQVVLTMHRSDHVTDADGVRQQTNGISTWLDASMVYGSSDQRARALRTLDGTGRLKTGPGDLLPNNSLGLPNEANGRPKGFFLAGDVRANENAALASVHTLWMREHNRWAEAFAALVPGASGDVLFELARMMVWAEIQSITFNEFLPVLLGADAVAPYTGYDDRIDAGIANEFSTAAFRMGHSMVSSELLRLGPDLQPIAGGGLSLEAAFFNPGELLTNGIEPLLLGATRQQARHIDPMIVDGLRNFLFGRPGAGGMDLATLNLARGREHGLAGYNAIRASVGLAPARSFMEVTSDPERAAKLEALYEDVDAIEAWIGGISEDHVEGALMGELNRTVIADQFRRLRDADPLWYENAFSPRLVQFIESQTLAVVLRRNTSLSEQIPDDPFRVPVE